MLRLAARPLSLSLSLSLCLSLSYSLVVLARFLTGLGVSPCLESLFARLGA